MVRRLLLIVVLVLVAVVAFVAGAWFLVPDSWIRAQVEERARAALGREVEIGTLALQRWPVALDVRDLRIANPQWAGNPDFVRLARLHVALDATALLSRSVRITELAVERPQIVLERAADGRAGWSFGEGAGGEAPDGAGGGGGWRVVVERASVSDGRILYVDHATGRGSEARDLAVDLRREAPAGELRLSARAEVDGAPLTLTGRLADPAQLAAGGSGPAELVLETPEGGGRVAGEIEAGARVRGQLDVAFSDLRGLLEQRLALSLPMAPEALRTVTLSSPFTADAEALELTELKLAVDDITGSGSLAVRGLDGRPRIEATLELGRLALDRYLPPASAEAEAEREEQAAAGGWPEEPVSLPLPLPADLRAQVGFAGLAVRGFETGAGRIEATVEGERATLRLASLELYDGTAQADVDLVAGPPHDLAVGWKVEGVRARPFLAALAGPERLEGRTFSEAKLAARGLSVKDLVSTLEGAGRVELRDGAILGVNIAAMVRQVTTLGLTEEKEPRRTDFTRLAAGFTVERGVLRTGDITLEAPLFRLHGAGTVDLPQRTLSLRLEPVFAATLEGQGGGEPVFQAGVPVVIEGPWSAPAWRFDIGGRLTEALRDPGQLAELVGRLRQDPDAVKGLRERFGGLQELFGVGPEKLRELLPGGAGALPGGALPGVPEGAVPALPGGLGGPVPGLPQPPAGEAQAPTGEGGPQPPAATTPVPDLRRLVPLVPGGGGGSGAGGGAQAPAAPEPKPTEEGAAKPDAGGEQPDAPDPGRLLRNLLDR